MFALISVVLLLLELAGPSELMSNNTLRGAPKLVMLAMLGLESSVLILEFTEVNSFSCEIKVNRIPIFESFDLKVDK